MGASRNRDDEQRAQQVNQREEMLLTVAGAEQAEDIGADGVEQADERQRARPNAGRYAAKCQVCGQVRHNEHQLEAAGEEGERHEEIAAMPDRFAQRFSKFQISVLS